MTAKLLARLFLLACLPASIGCNGPMVGGNTVKKVDDQQSPKAAVAALLELHPDAHIDWIDRVTSNAPTFYRLHYHQNAINSQVQGPLPEEFLYSDCVLAAMQIYPDRIRDAMKHIHPDSIIDKVEEFEDVGRQPTWYRLQYHTGTAAAQKAYFNPDGDPIPEVPGHG